MLVSRYTAISEPEVSHGDSFEGNLLAEIPKNSTARSIASSIRLQRPAELMARTWCDDHDTGELRPARRFDQSQCPSMILDTLHKTNAVGEAQNHGKVKEKSITANRPVAPTAPDFFTVAGVCRLSTHFTAAGGLTGASSSNGTYQPERGFIIAKVNKPTVGQVELYWRQPGDCWAPAIGHRPSRLTAGLQPIPPAPCFQWITTYP